MLNRGVDVAVAESDRPSASCIVRQCDGSVASPHKSSEELFAVAGRAACFAAHSLGERWRRTVGARGNCRVWNRLLIIADAAAEISANPCDEAYPRNGRLIGARSWQHIADLGNFTFRLLNRRVDFRAKRPAGGVLSGAHVGAKRFLEVGIASSNDRAVART